MRLRDLTTVLLAVLASGMLLTEARADEPKGIETAPAEAVVPGGVVAGAKPDWGAEMNPPAPPAVALRPAGHWLRHPWGCWSTHNSLGCSSLKAECTFIFGSCRAFFGEPCPKGPPPPVTSGDGSAPAGCGCP